MNSPAKIFTVTQMTDISINLPASLHQTANMHCVSYCPCCRPAASRASRSRSM